MRWVGPPTEAPELFPNFFSCLSLGPPAYLAAGLRIGSYLTMSIKLSAVFIDHFDAPALALAPIRGLRGALCVWRLRFAVELELVSARYLGGRRNQDPLSDS